MGMGIGMGYNPATSLGVQPPPLPSRTASAPGPLPLLQRDHCSLSHSVGHSMHSSTLPPGRPSQGPSGIGMEPSGLKHAPSAWIPPRPHMHAPPVLDTGK